MRVDGDGVGPLEARHAVRVARGETGRAPVRGVDVEPQTSRARRPRRGPARRRPSPCSSSPPRRRWRAASGRRRDPRGRRPPRGPAAAGTVRRTGGRAACRAGTPACRARARSRSAPGRSRRRARLPARAPRGGPREPAKLRQPDVARDGEGHEVRHHAARGEHPPRLGGHADRSRSHPVTSSSTNAPTGPACHTSTPWLDPLRQDLAGDRHRQRRRREVAEGPGVLRVVGGRRDALAELLQDLRSSVVGDVGAAPGASDGPKNSRARLRVGLAAHRPRERLVVEPVERLAPAWPSPSASSAARERSRWVMSRSSGSGLQSNRSLTAAG